MKFNILAIDDERLFNIFFLESFVWKLFRYKVLCVIWNVRGWFNKFRIWWSDSENIYLNCKRTGINKWVTRSSLVYLFPSGKFSTVEGKRIKKWFSSWEKSGDLTHHRFSCAFPAFNAKFNFESNVNSCNDNPQHTFSFTL